MGRKKSIPLIILKALEPFVNLKGEKFEVVDPKEYLLRVVDKDKESPFHFTIEKYQEKSPGEFHFLMGRCPQSKLNNASFRTWVDVADLESQFKIWLGLLDEYDNTKSFYDDPIIKSFEEEFFSEFELVEDDNVSPLKTNQILQLDEYLEWVEKTLPEYMSENAKEELAEINNDISHLRNSLTTKSKGWVVRRLTTIWAKIAKQGIKLIKEILSESKKTVIKECIQGIIDYVKTDGIELLNKS